MGKSTHYWSIYTQNTKSTRAKIATFSAAALLMISALLPAFSPFIERVFAASPVTVNGAHFDTIQEAINDTGTTDGDTVTVSTGNYLENITINKDVTLVAASGATPVINGQVTVNHDGVTIDGFTITNHKGTKGVSTKGVNDLLITNNTFTDIGTDSSVTGNVHAFWYQDGSTDTSSITVSSNMFTDIGHDMGNSSSAIGIGDSGGDSDISNVLITDNNISGVTARYNATYSDGGRGAYGIILNHAKISAGGSVSNAVISGNTISDLEGLWVHAIGLEGDTPNAVVSNNTISNIREHKQDFEEPIDGAGVLFEENNSLDTVTINQNNFNSDGSWYGVAIHPNLTKETVVNAQNNYWGTTNPEEIISSRIGTITGTINYSPWLCSTAPNGEPTTDGVCDSTGPEVSDIALNGQIIDEANVRSENCTKPTNYYPISGEVDLRAIITDASSDVASAQYKVRKVNANGCTMSSVFSSQAVNMQNTSDDEWKNTNNSIDTKALGLNGKYTVQLYTKDSPGNLTNQYIDVEIDNTAPQLTSVQLDKVSANGVTSAYLNNDKDGKLKVTFTTDESQGATGSQAFLGRESRFPGGGLTTSRYHATPVADSSNTYQILIDLNDPKLAGATEENLYLRIRTVDTLGNNTWHYYETSGTRYRLTVDNTAPIVPTLVAPAHNSNVNGASVTQAWSTSSDDVAYYLYESYRGYASGTLNTLHESEQVDNPYRTTVGMENGSFWWRVKAVDHLGNESEWSEPWRLTISNTSRPIQPPGQVRGNNTDTPNTPTANNTNSQTPRVRQLDNTDEQGEVLSEETGDESDAEVLQLNDTDTDEPEETDVTAAANQTSGVNWQWGIPVLLLLVILGYYLFSKRTDTK